MKLILRFKSHVVSVEIENERSIVFRGLCSLATESKLIHPPLLFLYLSKRSAVRSARIVCMLFGSSFDVSFLLDRSAFV